jgi:hypothetical protein
VQYKIAPNFILFNIYYKFNALQAGIAIAIPGAKKAFRKYVKYLGGHNEKVRHDA